MFECLLIISTMTDCTIFLKVNLSLENDLRKLSFTSLYQPFMMRIILNSLPNHLISEWTQRKGVCHCLLFRQSVVTTRAENVK